MKSQFLNRTPLSLLTAALVLSIGTGVPLAVQAQDLEEITVTGSRIVRRDFESNSPIVSIEAEQFESQAGLNIEAYLNQMPNFNPATTPVTTEQDVQITPVNSVGIASISLRGFGPNRNLVLVNGKRPVPINALMVTDINQIPSALLARVETITGGASSVYGADAVGGVTNFIMKENFEGLEVDGQWSTTEAGDGEEYRLTAVMGTDVQDGRGNVTIALEHYDRSVSLERERDFFTDAWANPNQNSNDFFVYGINGADCMNNCYNAATVNAIFADRPAGTNVYHPFSPPLGFARPLSFNSDGTVFANTAGGFYRYNGPIDGQEYTIENIYDGNSLTPGVEGQQLDWNYQNAYFSAPQERYSFLASGHYDITDDLTFTARATWAESKTRTLLFGTSPISGWEAQAPYDPVTDSPVDPTLDYTDPAIVAAVLANPSAFANPGFIATGQPGAQHPVPMEFAMLLNSRAFPGNGQDCGNVGTSLVNGCWIPAMNPKDSFPPRNTNNTNTVWQVEGALNYKLPIKDWTGELYFSHGESSTYNINTGNMSLSRWRALIAEDDYGRGAEISGNANSSRPFFGAADITCQSGFYDTIFGGDVAPSQDCVDAINATLQSRTQNQQDVVEINLQGGIFDLPAGELRGAAGFQYRKNTAQFYPDILQSTVSFTDQVIGVYPTGYLDASTSVNDFYVEALVPIVADLPYMQKLELETGARYSDYDHAPDTWTYKFMGNAVVNDWLRLRGGFNRATRAPNLGELFLNTQEIFTIGGVNFGDPCGLRSGAPWGAGGAAPDPILDVGEPETEIASGQTAAGALSTMLICQAQMGGPGSTGATAYYGGNATGAGAGGAFNWVLQAGNPNLKSEEADTFTAGFVMNSPWDNPWLDGVSLTMDWWMVDISDAIQLYSIDYARNLCYGSITVTDAAGAAAQAATPECMAVGRDLANGNSTTITIGYDNQATLSTSGIDFAGNWMAQLEDLGFGVPGGVSVNVQATWLDYYKTKQSPLPFDVETDWAGSLGPNLTGTNAGAYDYRIFSNFTYFRDRWSVSLRWRHMPSVWSAAYASERAIIENNQSGGTILSYTPRTDIKTDAYNVVDLSFNWQINDMFSLRGGINNLFDSDPEVINATVGYPTGTDRSVCGSAPGCVNPGGPSLGDPSLGVTNAGYYDGFGRRFFVGLKASF